MKRTTLPRLAIFAGLLAAGLPQGALAAPPAGPAAAAPAKKHKKPADAPATPPELTHEQRVEQAKQLLIAAEEKLKAGDFAGALAGYRAVNEVARSPLALFRIGFCLEKVGTRAEAEQAYHRFLGLPPPDTMGEERRLAEERLADLAAGTLKVSSQPVAIWVVIDGKPPVATPLEVHLPAGKHAVQASAPDYEPASREVEVTTGGVMELAIMLRPLPAAAAPAPAAAASPAPLAPAPSAPTEVRTTTIVAGVALGLAAVGIGVGTAFGVDAINAQSDYNRAPSQSLADRQKASALVADASIGGALVFGTVGTVLLLRRNATPASPPASALQIVPLLSPRAQGAAALVRF